MVHAIMMLNVQRRAINEVAESISGMEGVSAVYSVSGAHDLVVIIGVRDNESLAGLVTQRILMIGEIERSETMLAFKAYSSHDLERMFSLGLEQD